MASQTSPMPSHLKTFCQNPPWRISPEVFQRISQHSSNLPYKKIELLPSDPDFQFVTTYFHDQKPTNRSIAKVYCIHNPNEAMSFESLLPSLEIEAADAFFKSQWGSESHPDLRSQAIQRFNTSSSLFSPFEIVWTGQRKQRFTLIKVLPLWHGSTLAKCESICKSGFTFFGKHGSAGMVSSTDIGFFGSGIYFTNSARYAADTYSDGQNLLLGWVSMREPFPVISDTPNPKDCSDMKMLKGQGAYHKYNAHYIPVIPDPKNPTSANYYPCPRGHQPVWDEIVVFQRNQTLTRFWIVMQVDLTQPVPGTSLTVGALLELVSDCLNQQKLQENEQIYNLLEDKENSLIPLDPLQPLSSENIPFYNLLKQLLDKNKNVVDRIAKKLLGSTSAPLSPASPSVMHSSHPSMVSNTNDNSVGSYPFPSSAHSPSNIHMSPLPYHPSPSYYPPIISNNNNPAPSYSMPNPVPSFSNLSISSPSSPTPPPMTSYPANIAPTHHSFPSPTLSQPSISIQPTVNASPSLPSIAFGAVQWKQYLGDVGAEPLLPSNIHQTLQGPCPFWPDKKVQETHLLVLIPKTVNGKPLTMKSLGELVKKPKQGNKTQYSYFELGEYTDPPAPASHWVLMTRDVLPGSRDKSYKKQQALVASYAKKTKTPYQVPNVLDAAVCIFLEYIRSGTHLYNDNPWTYTCCQEKWDADWQLVVGGFAAGGLDVGIDSSGSGVGVGALRKF